MVLLGLSVHVLLVVHNTEVDQRFLVQKSLIDCGTMLYCGTQMGSGKNVARDSVWHTTIQRSKVHLSAFSWPLIEIIMNIAKDVLRCPFPPKAQRFPRGRSYSHAQVHIQTHQKCHTQP